MLKGPTLSKSARRRLQLLKRGEKIVLNQIQPGTALVPRPSQPVARRKRNRNRGSRNLAVKNPYLYSLMDPENNSGARVPDLTGIPTSVIQCEYEGSLDSNAAGLAGFYLTPMMAAGCFNTLTAGSTAAAITYTSSSWINQNQYNAVYGNYRPVSAVMYVDYIGTSTNDSGLTTAMWLSRTQSLPTTVVDAANRTYGETTPTKMGTRILWRPMDNRDVEFAQVATANPLPAIGFVSSGLVPNQTGCLRVRAFVNFECIPYSDTFDIAAASPSPINRNWLEDAFKWGQTTADKISTLLPYAQSITTVGMNALNWYQSNQSQRPYGRNRQGPVITSL